jgi:hypothetical protein
VKIPEEWRRAREKETALTVTLRWLKLPLIGTFGALAILLLVARIRAGEMPWRFAFLVGGVVAATVVLRTALSLDALWAEYKTSIPEGMYTVVIVVSFVMAALGSFVGGAFVAGLAGALYPQALTMLRAAQRRLYARDALVAGAVALGLALGVPVLRELVGGLVPGGRLLDDVRWPQGIESRVPFLFLLAKAVSGAVFVAGSAAIVTAVVTKFFRRALVQALLALFFVLSFLPGPARTPAEYASAALSLLVLVAALWLLVRFFLRDNPLAWVAAAWFGLGGASAIRLLAEPSGSYRLHGAVVFAVILLPALWLLLGRKPRETSA